MPSPIDAARLRADAVESILHRKSGHVMSSLSASDLIASALSWLTQLPAADEVMASTLVLSKGHAAPALYAGLAQIDASLSFSGQTLRRIDSPFGGHPRAGAVPTVLTSTGSLGVGLAFAAGVALGDPTRRVVVIASDGELQEGLAWETLRIAARCRLRNLLILVDFNGWQTSSAVPSGETFSGAMGLRDVETVEVDGHDTQAIGSLLARWDCTSPRLVRATTSRLRYLPSLTNPDELYGDRIPDHTRLALQQDLGIDLVHEGSES